MRFISQDDPVLSNAQGEPIGSNLYVYCLNNPVMNSDLSGHWVFGMELHPVFMFRQEVWLQFLIFGILMEIEVF